MDSKSRDKPWIDESGCLVIPGECPDDRYKWWKKEGQSIAQTLQELRVSREVWQRYTILPYYGDENAN